MEAREGEELNELSMVDEEEDEKSGEEEGREDTDAELPMAVSSTVMSDGRVGMKGWMEVVKVGA